MDTATSREPPVTGNRRFVARLAALGIVIALANPVQRVGAQVAQENIAAPPVIEATAAPRGTESLGVQWVRITAPDLGVMLGAVVRPEGAGPFPVVLVLHGTHGFGRQYVEIAKDLAAGGVIAVAACWFRSDPWNVPPFIDPIACPEAPAMPYARSPRGLQIVGALVQAVRALPGVRSDRIGLFGHSRGASVSVHYVVRAGDVRAAVLDSGGYPSGASIRIKAPILIMQGTADNMVDGDVNTNVQAARQYEARALKAGKPVESVYYDGAGHNEIFTSASQRSDEIQRSLAFFRRYFGD